jgi:hypothetical protein
VPRRFKALCQCPAGIILFTKRPVLAAGLCGVLVKQCVIFIEEGRVVLEFIHEDVLIRAVILTFWYYLLFPVECHQPECKLATSEHIEFAFLIATFG